LNDVYGKNWEKESRSKATNQVEESSRESENETNQSYESLTQNLKQKDNFRNASSAK